MMSFPNRVLGLGLLIVTLGGCAGSELVVLLEGEDGKVGELDVTSEGNTLSLSQPLAAARVGGSGVQAGNVSPAEVRSNFSAALDAEPAAPTSFTLYFKTGSVNLAPGSERVLEDMLAEVRKRDAADIQVTGHTDRVGQLEDNDKLALTRAKSVLSNLRVQIGLEAQTIRTVGRGEREPLVPTADEIAEPRNRRVEIIVR